MQPAKSFSWESSRPVTFGSTKDNTAFVDVSIPYWVKFSYGPWGIQKGLLWDLEESVFPFFGGGKESWFLFCVGFFKIKKTKNQTHNED